MARAGIDRGDIGASASIGLIGIELASTGRGGNATGVTTVQAFTGTGVAGTIMAGIIAGDR
ncbi:hypothetical protein MOX02_59320 [Methylobacterium oxalidis]|uniref:Uncharacterized protein n=1 Tax=Methylobacterium oxalidis TaxID=944322 RepID=A0A512JD68_9HYPH|nr:hypothetical protein [Methylobacterium oxalidis]GEP07894.1 hypothetical protein MOX02_59320 [Methylobacterium oxalidis]GLS64850.1 hypothetical protein GCM10007888_32310 [Methylobacterium oxalidis]